MRVLLHYNFCRKYQGLVEECLWQKHKCKITTTNIDDILKLQPVQYTKRSSKDDRLKINIATLIPHLLGLKNL